MNMICYNGQFLPADAPILSGTNRGFKYGDGLFETMRIHKGILPLAGYHFHRLYDGLKQLSIQISHLNKEALLTAIFSLCKMNGCKDFGRIRLTVFRDHNNEGSFVIEATALVEGMVLNEKGYSLTICPDIWKSCDAISSLKSTNYLPYVQAERYAFEQGADEALLLNQYGAISDGSKTNIFINKQGTIMTPAINQGCVNGVMRRYIIESLYKKELPVQEGTITSNDLLEADEIFLTNAIRGIQWVKQFQGKEYVNEQTKKLFQALCSTIFS